MKLLNQIFAIIFYILFFSWAFFKIRNIILVKKMNCKETYKNIKKDLKNQKLSKYLFRIIIVSIIIFVIYLVIGLIAGAFALFMTFINLGGIGYHEAGTNSTFYDNLMSYVANHFSLFKYVYYYVYMIVYMVLVMAIYINIKSYKLLTSDDILTDLEQETVQTTIKNESNNKSKKNSLILLSTFVIIVFIFILTFSSITNIISVDLEDIVFPSMNTSVTMTPNWYFFHNDRMYVYDNYGDQLYSTNLSGKNKKILSTSEDLRYANIFMVYNEEMFYYTEYHRGIKKLNLKTGEIKKVVDNKYLDLIPDTLKDGKVLVTYTNNYIDKSHTYFATLDLETGLLSNEKKIKYVTQQPYFYCNENNKIYYIDSYDDQNTIYEDNKIIYTYDANNNLSGWKSRPNSNISDIVFVQDNYIFAIIANKILKFDLSSYAIIEEKELDKSFSLIPSVREGSARRLDVEEGHTITSIYPFFSVIDKNNSTNSDIKIGDIYKFNSKTLSFEKIIEKNYSSGFLQKYDDYFILQTDNETVIYNAISGKYRIFDSTNYSVEDNYIYLMTYTGDFYHQKENNLKFKIEKILLEDTLK